MVVEADRDRRRAGEGRWPEREEAATPLHPCDGDAPSRGERHRTRKTPGGRRCDRVLRTPTSHLQNPSFATDIEPDLSPADSQDPFEILAGEAAKSARSPLPLVWLGFYHRLTSNGQGHEADGQTQLHLR
jgi:hypothetical protein